MTNPRWAITARLNDGQLQYYCESTERQGQAHWSPRENQARTFATEAEALKVMDNFELNSAAKDYGVARLSRP